MIELIERAVRFQDRIAVRSEAKPAIKADTPTMAGTTAANDQLTPKLQRAVMAMAPAK